jgi:hypothetical protein
MIASFYSLHKHFVSARSTIIDDGGSYKKASLLMDHSGKFYIFGISSARISYFRLMTQRKLSIFLFTILFESFQSFIDSESCYYYFKHIAPLNQNEIVFSVKINLNSFFVYSIFCELNIFTRFIALQTLNIPS